MQIHEWPGTSSIPRISVKGLRVQLSCSLELCLTSKAARSVLLAYSQQLVHVQGHQRNVLVAGSEFVLGAQPVRHRFRVAIPLPLRARAPLLEASHLNHVEEQSTEGVGHFRVKILQAPTEFCVAVAVWSRERRIVANAVDARVGRYRYGTVVVLPAADVLATVVAKIVVRLGESARTAPLRTWIDQSSARRLILSFLARGFARLLQVCHEVARHLPDLFRISAEYHLLDNAAVRIQGTEGRVRVQFHHSGHGIVCHQDAGLDAPQRRYQQ